MALHPALTALRELYDDGSLGILNNVGYPNPDRSHFRSMDIWQTGSASTEYVTTGWVGRYLDAQCHGCDKPTYALEIDDVLSLALKGENSKAIAMKDPKRLFGTSNEKFFRDVLKDHKPARLSHQAGITGKKQWIISIKQCQKPYHQLIIFSSKVNYIPHQRSIQKQSLGNGLKTIASLIFSDINTKVYYISLGSFDTHVNQQMQQQRLFTELSDAVKAFTADLKKNNRFNDVLMFTFSEFGRRVSQNASGGTDHGTANNMFLIGGALKQKGIINPMPDLNRS